MGRFGEQAVHRVAERQLQAERHTTRPATDAARQVDEQRMLGIDNDTGCRQLLLETLTGHRVAEEQVPGIFVIDEVATRIAFGLTPPLESA